MANLFSRIFNKQAVEKVEERSHSQALQDVKNSLLHGLSNGYNNDISPDNAHLISTVYTCINVLSNTVSRLPIKINKLEGRKKVPFTDHPFFDSLVYQPENHLSYQQWISQLITALYFDGNAYAYITPKKQLQFLHPDLISDIKMFNGVLMYQSAVLKTVIPYYDLIHFKSITKQLNNYKGLNPIDSLRHEINIQYKSEQALSNFLGKNGNTTKVLQPVTQDMRVANEDVQAVVKKLTEDMSIRSTDGLIVVPPLYELKELSLGVDAVRYLESNKYTTSQICGLFGVPEFMAGAGVNSQYGKYEEQSIAFIQTTIANIVNILKSELEFKLLTIDERKAGVSIDFDLRALTATDLLTHVNAMKILKDCGALNNNEMRVEFNLPWVGDESPENPMNGFYQQMQYQNLLQPNSGSTASVNYLIQS